MRTKPTRTPSTPRPKATPHSTFSSRAEGSALWGTGDKGEQVGPETWLGSPTLGNDVGVWADKGEPEA